jgi:hypothetical protein
MRFVPLILGLMLMAAMTVLEIYDFFITNEGLAYYSSHSSRLMPVVLLAFVGGVLALGISRLSPGSQRFLKLAALGAFGAVLLCTLGMLIHFVYSLARLETIEIEDHSIGWIAAALASSIVLAVFVCWEFWQAWRRA